MNGSPVTVLLDQGSVVNVVAAYLVNKDQYTGSSNCLKLMNGYICRHPTAIINVESPYYSGSVEACAMKNPAFDLVIGATSKSSLRTKPTLAVTRLQAKLRLAPKKKLIINDVGEILREPNMENLQKEDPSLIRLLALGRSGKRKTRRGKVSYFFFENSILYRRVGDKKQLVVPECYRPLVFKLAHSSPLAGHQGKMKTTNRVLSQFFWPAITAELSRWISSCEICQKTTDKGRLRPAPIVPLPCIGEPFYRCAIDLVGPIIPASVDGFKYILVLTDFSTKWPEAIPLKNISTETVANALLSIFTRLGTPKQVLSDRGTQFTGAMMKEVYRLMAIQGLYTTAYHPQCNGACERLNGTLKKMLKRLSAEQPTQWPKFINPLLYAYREVEHSGTGYSPFYLMYGRQVRGPLHILRQAFEGNLTEDEEVKTAYQYVLEMRERLADTLSMAKDELQKSGEKSASYFKQHAKLRVLQAKDECLLLLPTSHNKLLAQWQGPYVVTKVLGPLNYQVNVEGTLKNFHINMLKKFETPHVPNKALSALACNPCSSPMIVESSSSRSLDNLDVNSSFIKNSMVEEPWKKLIVNESTLSTNTKHIVQVNNSHDTKLPIHSSKRKVNVAKPCFAKNILRAKPLSNGKICTLIGPTLQEREAEKEEVIRHVREICVSDGNLMEPLCTMATVKSNSEPGQLETLNMKQTQDFRNVVISKMLSSRHQNQLSNLCQNYREIFTDVPLPAYVAPYKIKLTDPAPIRSRPYRIPHHIKDKVTSELCQMEKEGYLEPSESPYASPMVVVHKNDASIRICGDFRKVNTKIQFDAEPMSDQKDIFARLSSSKIFSKMDLAKGFYQLQLDAKSRPYTAMCTPLGLKQYTVVPFGLSISPAVFNRALRKILVGIKFLEIFMDDLLVHTPTWEEHLITLEEVFQRFQRHRISVKPDKCELGTRGLEFLGHWVGDGIQAPQEKNTKKIYDFPQPTNKKEVRSFLGRCQYYAEFIPGYTQIAKPLYATITKPMPNQVTWSPELAEAFSTLKAALCTRPVLQLPDMCKPFILQTDASALGIGAVLLQVQSDTMPRPIAYWSRKLKPAEVKYATIERELLAIIEAVRKFHVYLYGSTFVLETDHMPLAYLKKYSENCKNGRLTRWSLFLQDYSFDIRYIKGSTNLLADYLSRSPT